MFGFVWVRNKAFQGDVSDSSGHWIPARRPRLGSDFAEVIPFLRSRECPDYNAMVISLCHGLPIRPLSTGHEHRGRRETIILQAPPHV
jgi:hypothetical protein